MKEGPLTNSWVLPKDHIRTGNSGEYQGDNNGAPAASAPTGDPNQQIPAVLEILVLLAMQFWSICSLGHSFLLLAFPILLALPCLHFLGLHP